MLKTGQGFPSRRQKEQTHQFFDARQIGNVVASPAKVAHAHNNAIDNVAPFASTSMSASTALCRMGSDWGQVTYVMRLAPGCVRADTQQRCQAILAQCRCGNVDARCLSLSKTACATTLLCVLRTRVLVQVKTLVRCLR